MLVVITIVGVLATISIGAYSRYRRSSLLEIAADNLISTLYKARDEVSLGKVNGDSSSDGVSTATCRGISIENKIIKIVKAEYNSKRTYDSESMSWTDGGCVTEGASAGVSAGFESVNFENDVDVLEVSPRDTFSILFVPPNGEIVTKGLGVGDGVGSDIAKITLGYEANADQKRVVVIDLKTGLAHVETP